MWTPRRAHTQTHYLSVSGECSTSIFCIQDDGKLPYFIFHLIENPPKALATPRLPKSDSPLYSQSSQRRYTGSHFLLLPSNTAPYKSVKDWTPNLGINGRAGSAGAPPSTTQSKQGPTPHQRTFSCSCSMHRLLSSFK